MPPVAPDLCYVGTPTPVVSSSRCKIPFFSLTFFLSSSPLSPPSLSAWLDRPLIAAVTVHAFTSVCASQQAVRPPNVMHPQPRNYTNLLWLNHTFPPPPSITIRPFHLTCPHLCVVVVHLTITPRQANDRSCNRSSAFLDNVTMYSVFPRQITKKVKLAFAVRTVVKTCCLSLLIVIEVIFHCY